MRRINFHVDLFCVYEVGDYGRWMCLGALRQMDKKFHEELDTITWAGRKLRIPSHAEEYLSTCYGNWQVPDRDFDPRYQDGSIAEKGF